MPQRVLRDRLIELEVPGEINDAYAALAAGQLIRGAIDLGLD